MNTEQKIAHINDQISGLEAEIWKLDCNAKALARVGLKDRAEAVAKQSGECQQLIDAFKEQLVELK